MTLRSRISLIPSTGAVFDSFSIPIQRYDFFRYLAVYRFGGFYFDTDVFLAFGLEDLLGFGCVFPFEELTVHSFLRARYAMDWEIGNYAFGTIAGHPFLDANIKNCVRAQQHPEWAEAMMKSIPRLFCPRVLRVRYDRTRPCVSDAGRVSGCSRSGESAISGGCLRNPGSEILINGRWEPIGRPRGYSDRLTPFLAVAVSTRSSVLEPKVGGRRVWPQWEDRGRL
jgi:hypothetical protein